MTFTRIFNHPKPFAAQYITSDESGYNTNKYFNYANEIFTINNHVFIISNFFNKCRNQI